MKTAAEFEPIALWMGWRNVQGVTKEVWVAGDNQCKGAVKHKTSLTPSEAVEALEKLVEKGYEWEMRGRDQQVECLIDRQREDGSVLWITEDEHTTVTEAVEMSIAALIEKEGR